MASSRRVIRWILYLVILSLFTVGGASFATAQCAVRSDWSVYIVQRGDTLARIALRYNTTFAVLTAANCLWNPNLIFAGQQLRVPPTGTVAIPPPVIYPSDLAATYQTFERGFMTWKAGTGEIGVYYAPSGVIANGGAARVFSARTYGNLPDGPWPLMPQPAGTLRPTNGFGRVWLNFPDVAQGLGWATAPEVGYLMRVYPPNATTYQFTLPDTRTIYVNNNQVWSFTSGIPTVITPTPTGPIVTTTSTAYQPYQNGFMIWEAHTQNVVAFNGNGTYQVFPVRNYGSLPDNPVLDPTPAGLVRPAFGFGKVWGNYPTVRQALGWATANEAGYTTTFRSSSPIGYPQTCFLLPDGRNVTYALANGIRFWNYTGACG
jgi:LysM repeat protein